MLQVFLGTDQILLAIQKMYIRVRASMRQCKYQHNDENIVSAMNTHGLRRTMVFVQFDQASSVFLTRPTVPDDIKVVFVSDMFVEDYVGGAELTTEALISSSPCPIFKVHSRDVTPQLMNEASDKFWLFGNFTMLNPQLLAVAMSTLTYGVIEYDYKYCRYRSPEKHQHSTGMPCDCVGQSSGRLVSDFYRHSKRLWWMSEAQRDRYLTAFPFLSEVVNCVISSVFEQKTLEMIADMREHAPATRKGWVVLGSDSWIKGCDQALTWCQQTGKEPDVVWGLPYHELLERLSRAEGLVYLPKGGDTCPRLVIEAKLLGCRLQLNENVQHRHETWFDTDDLRSIQGYLLSSHGRFWADVKNVMDYRPTVSGYTTTYNCVKQEYPFRQCVKSMLAFCDEVCVVDGGSIDGTWDELVKLAHPDAFAPDSPLSCKEQMELIEDIRTTSLFGPGVSPHQHKLAPSRIKLREVKRDWSSKRHPVFDGMQKAEARRMCVKEFCWQMDSDEVVHEDDAPKIDSMCRMMPKDADVLSLPVIEYWGGADKVRLDIQPWKWRLSRNRPHVTHGIPAELRRTDAAGDIFAAEGSDGCDMIDSNTGERLPHVSFYSPQTENLRRIAMTGHENARQQYESWFNDVVRTIPSVFHYSWYNLERKIRLYRDYWTRHWVQLSGGEYVDSAEQNMMFDVSWSQVTDEMITLRAQQLRTIGGWIWHRKWTGERTPWISCSRAQPKAMLSENTSMHVSHV